jgi:hypothetical protein
MMVQTWLVMKRVSLYHLLIPAPVLALDPVLDPALALVLAPILVPILALALVQAVAVAAYLLAQRILVALAVVLRIKAVCLPCFCWRSLRSCAQAPCPRLPVIPAHKRHSRVGFESRINAVIPA